MTLLALPAFSDNYIWLLQDGGHALVVDPGDAQPVQAALDAHGLTLDVILVTHHHSDHVDGVPALLAAHPLAQLRRPAREVAHLGGLPQQEGDAFAWRGWRFGVLDVPGHTLGHIAYVAKHAEHAPIAFCGDTLFRAGCGRLFEGSPAQMHGSLQKLAALAPTTRVCGAHEYTVGNLRFAQAVEPANGAVAAALQAALAQRAQGLPTLPSTISEELLINPFLRCDVPAVVAAANTAAHTAQARDQPMLQPAAVFGALRAWKNRFP